MPASYKIDKERRLVITTVKGEHTYEEVLDHQRQLLTDPDFDPSFAQISDFTYATLTKFTRQEVASLAQSSVFSARSRRAFILPNPADFGLGRMYEQLRGLNGEPGIRAFRTLEDAVDWIAAGPPPDH